MTTCINKMPTYKPRLAFHLEGQSDDYLYQQDAYIHYTPRLEALQITNAHMAAQNAKLLDTTIQGLQTFLSLKYHELLPLQTVLALALLNKACFDMMNPIEYPFLIATYISSYLFYWPPEFGFQLYKPNRIIVCHKVRPQTFPSYVSEIIVGNFHTHPFAFVSPLITHITFGKSYHPSFEQLFPSTITHLTFNDVDFTESLQLPPSLTHLSFLSLANSKCRATEKALLNLPPSLTHLHLDIVCKSPLLHLPKSLQRIFIGAGRLGYHPFDHLPRSLLELIFFGSCECWSLDHLPPSLTHLLIESPEQVQADYLPSSLTHLGLLCDVTPSIDYLPTAITTLILASSYSLPVDYLPPTLTTLILGDHFNHPVDNLPSSLTELHLGNSFNQPLDYLPSSLLSLSLGTSFNKPLDNLPNSLFNLEIFSTSHYDHASFNQHLDHLPPSLKSLSIQSLFTHPLNYLPIFLKNLSLAFPEYLYPLQHLPKHLHSLHLFEVIDPLGLPLALTHLSFSDNFDQCVDFLPFSLQSLDFGDSFDHPVDHLPPGITVLRFFGDKFNQPINHLPPSLVTLTLSKNFNHPIDSLPPKLENLALGHYFNHPIDRLPPSLCVLYLGNSFNRPLKHLPPHLKVFAWEVTDQRLPTPSRCVLRVGGEFDQPLHDLPSRSVRVLIDHKPPTRPHPPCNGVVVSFFKFHKIFFSPRGPACKSLRERISEIFGV